MAWYPRALPGFPQAHYSTAGVLTSFPASHSCTAASLRKEDSERASPGRGEVSWLPGSGFSSCFISFGGMPTLSGGIRTQDCRACCWGQQQGSPKEMDGSWGRTQLVWGGTTRPGHSPKNDIVIFDNDTPPQVILMLAELTWQFVSFAHWREEITHKSNWQQNRKIATSET